MSEDKLRLMDRDLAVTAAEMFELPLDGCHRRGCRRANRCKWVWAATNEPLCVSNLSDARRKFFRKICEEARSMRNYLGDTGLTFASSRIGVRRIEDIAAEIARRNIPKCDRKRWHAAWRERSRMPPPWRP